MGEIIFYKLNGEIEKQEELSIENIKNIGGMKARCTLKDKSEIIGYADTIEVLGNKQILIKTFVNLDEDTHELVGKGTDRYAENVIRIDFNDIEKVEVILYSSPRWGTEITNQFRFYNK